MSSFIHVSSYIPHHFFLIEIVSERIVWTFSTSAPPPAPPPAPWRRCSPIKLREPCPDTSEGYSWMRRTHQTNYWEYKRTGYINIYIYIGYTNWPFTPLCLMDTGCFTAAQRISCHTMNADLFKPVPERGPQQSSAPVKTNRNKPVQTKPELAQVVTDSKTGRSYSKGKLLGKVRRFDFTCACLLFRRFFLWGTRWILWFVLTARCFRSIRKLPSDLKKKIVISRFPGVLVMRE